MADRPRALACADHCHHRRGQQRAKTRLAGRPLPGIDRAHRVLVRGQVDGDLCGATVEDDRRLKPGVAHYMQRQVVLHQDVRDEVAEPGPAGVLRQMFDQQRAEPDMLVGVGDQQRQLRGIVRQPLIGRDADKAPGDPGGQRMVRRARRSAQPSHVLVRCAAIEAEEAQVEGTIGRFQMQLAQGCKVLRYHRADVHQTAIGAHGIDTAAFTDRHPSTIPYRTRGGSGSWCRSDHLGPDP